MRFTIFILLLLTGSVTTAQQLVFPSHADLTHLQEGKTLSFVLSVRDPDQPARFSLEGGNGYGMQLDSLGNFTWTPSFDLVDRLTKEKEIGVIFQAELKDNKRLRQPVNFIVAHVNRPPIVAELPIFYVKQGSANKYQISSDYAHDPDGDPLIFKPHESQMPEGALLTSLGQFSWAPSRNQFLGLKNNHLSIEFVVEDQPDKAATTGKIHIAQTQLDLPPDLLLVPGDSLWSIHENENIYLKIYVTDPNGDENIEQVDFLSSDIRVPRSVFKENSKVQKEFTWSPGYDFVEESEKKREVVLTFFAIDKSNNRVQRKVRVTIMDTENVEEKDKLLQHKYVGSMTSTKILIDLLDQNYEKLDAIYKHARRGKKNRTILTATLGGVTGISPLVLPADPSKSVSIVGGTSVLTLNSLEAGQVIGRNTNDLQNKIKTNRDLRNQLQLRGNYFARKYALKSTRRSVEFEQDRDELSRMMNSDAVSSLEIPAAPASPPTTKEIKKTFPDFSEE